jgi:predicted Zn-dependent protease
MRINAKNFSYNMSDDTSFTNVDLDSLLVHELGHVLGLAHNTEDGSAMHATLDEGQVRRKLGDVDLQDLKCEY